MTTTSNVDSPPVVHPSWCRGDCAPETTGGWNELFHEARVLALPLAMHHEVVRGDDAPQRRYDEVFVGLNGYVGWRDGRRPVAAPSVVVLDLPEAVNALTAAEAARLGAALLEASRQLAGDHQAAGGDR